MIINTTVLIETRILKQVQNELKDSILRVFHFNDSVQRT